MACVYAHNSIFTWGVFWRFLKALVSGKARNVAHRMIHTCWRSMEGRKSSDICILWYRSWNCYSFIYNYSTEWDFFFYKYGLIHLLCKIRKSKPWKIRSLLGKERRFPNGGIDEFLLSCCRKCRYDITIKIKKTNEYLS